MLWRTLSGQSAIEYLMTYGWMLLAVSIISGVIFALAPSESADNVNWPQGEKAYVDDSGVTVEDELSFIIQNRGRDQLIISEVKVIDPDTEEWIAQNFTTNPSIGVADNKIFQIPNVTRGEGANTLDVEVIYNSGDLENIKAEGTISGNLQLEETDLTYEASQEASREYYYEGESENLDVSDLDSVDVVVEGAGGVTSDESPPGDVTYEDVKAGDGGKAEAKIDVSDINQLEIYVGGTGGEAIGEDHTVAGWGWKEGGTGHGDGGAGGSASAIVVDGNPILIADGGGGGTSWDTFTWGSGGGGAREGESYGNNWGNSGENGKGSGYGGDGAYGDDSDAEALVPAEDGRGEIIDGSIVSEEVITEGAGGKDGEHGYISIEWVTEETIKRPIPAE